MTAALLRVSVLCWISLSGDCTVANRCRYEEADFATHVSGTSPYSSLYAVSVLPSTLTEHCPAERSTKSVYRYLGLISVGSFVLSTSPGIHTLRIHYTAIFLTNGLSIVRGYCSLLQCLTLMYPGWGQKS